VGDLTARVVESLESVDAAAWDALDHGPSPFTQHGFLRALERSGSVGAEAGWQPIYVIVERAAADADAKAGAPPEQNTVSAASAGSSPARSASADAGADTIADEGSRRRRRPRRARTRAGQTRPAASREPVPAPGRELVGAVAAYVKIHSYGEYIFDWSWARASQQAGIPYYPKLVIAAPMTPATGRRLLVAPGAPREAVVAALVAGVQEVADRVGCQSIHWLFCSAEEQRELAALGYAPRASFQYHWRNHGYASFDDFLALMTSRKRKQLRKERARAQRAIDDLQFVAGGDLTGAEIETLDGFYRRTTYEHGGFDYLRPGFFQALVRLLPERVQVARVRKGGAMIAGALFLETPQALYGRYWGCGEDIDLLHFETTCYAGIDRCIAKGIPLFEAGAQGQHKLRRGFLPRPTYSAHWLRHEGLRKGIESFLRDEAVAVAAGMDELAEASPFRAEVLAALRRGLPPPAA
jgi:hypothetical protein